MIKKHRYRELDSLRGMAALLVVFFHFTMGRQEYNSFLKIGTTGVDLFFMISGFVIFMSLETVSNGTEFVINRISRLYPTYWASVTFTFILIISIGVYRHTDFTKSIFIQFIGNLSMFQFYFSLPDLDGPYWTLIIEMIFYIFMLVLFKFNLLKHINVIGFGLCCAIFMLIHFCIHLSIVSIVFKWIPLVQFFPLFFSGIIFYKLNNGFVRSNLGYILVSFCLVCQISLFQYSGRSISFITLGEYICMLIVYFILFTLFVNNKLNFIINSVTIFLGKISFALYFLHQYISLNIIIPIFHERIGINFWVVVILFNLPIIIAVATFITYRIEIPYSIYLKAKLKRMFISNYLNSQGS